MPGRRYGELHSNRKGSGGTRRQYPAVNRPEKSSQGDRQPTLRDVNNMGADCES